MSLRVNGKKNKHVMLKRTSGSDFDHERFRIKKKKALENFMSSIPRLVRLKLYFINIFNIYISRFVIAIGRLEKSSFVCTFKSIFFLSEIV